MQHTNVSLNTHHGAKKKIKLAAYEKTQFFTNTPFRNVADLEIIAL